MKLAEMGESYSYRHIHQVINEAANDIIDAAALPESGAVDALNFLVSATLLRLADPKLSLADVAKTYRLEDDMSGKPLKGKKALAQIIGWMHE
jgi:hypothetical protein